MAYERAGQKKHFWIFMILLTVGVLIIPLGLDWLGGVMSADEVNTFVYESIGLLSVIMICVLILVVFYIVNTVIGYRFKNGWPKDYWSAWGIFKKAIALVALIVFIVIYAVILSNVIYDVNAEPVYTTITISDQRAAGIDNKMSLYYYEVDDTEKVNAKYRNALFVKQGLSVDAGKTYKVRVFEKSNFWVAVEEVKG